MSDVVVVGGGLAGLCAAYGLSAAAAAVTLIDSAPRLGGQIETARADGFVVEHGAEGFVASSQAVPELCRELGIADSLISQRTRQTLLLRGDKLEPLAPGEAATVLGFQVGTAAVGRGIVTLHNGMESLVEALCGRLKGRVAFRLGARATGLEAAGSRWRVALADGANVTADAVVVAVPRRPARQLLTPIVGALARSVTTARTVSSVTVSLAFPAENVQRNLQGTGFVVAGLADEDVGLRACTFCTSKFPERAPAHWHLVRAFFRPTQEELHEWTDARWVKHATDQLRSLLGIEGGAARSWVSRWPDALPRFPQEYDARVKDLMVRLRNEGQVELAGAAFHGVGIDGAVRSGINAAAQLGGKPVYGSTASS